MRTERIFKLITILFVLLAAFGRAIPIAAEDDLQVTVQPEDVEIDYPDSASFHVEVNHPEEVASYQWYLFDGWTLFELEGESAKTDTLVIPSIEYSPNPHYFSCVITDKNGNEISSQEAVLTNPNFDEDKKVLYVGEYALEPGESLDLSETFTGSGKVTYDANGVDVTFEDVHYSNEKVLFDRRLSPSMGVFFFGRHMQEPEIFFHFKGENVFENVFFDPDYNNAGIVFNTWFAQDENQPTAVFDGDGTLTLKGGSNQIYSDGNVEIATTLDTYGLENVYCDSITGYTILIDENAKLDLHANGTGIRARGDLRTYEGSQIKVTSVAPHVSVGPTFKSLIQVNGRINMQGSDVDLYGTAYPETFIPYQNYLVNFTGIEVSEFGDISLDTTKVRIAFDCEKGEDIYAMNFCGIIGGEMSSSLVLTASSIDISMDVPEVYNTTGILIEGDVNVDKDSSIKVNLASLGEVAGIEADRRFIVIDGIVDSTVKSYDDTYCFGIVTGGADIQLNEDSYYVYSKVENGIALAADTGERGDVEGAVDGYEATILVPGGKASFLTPAKAVVNLYGVPGYDDTIKAETVFDGNDMSAPAREVRIGVRKNNNSAYIVCGLGALCAIGAAVTLNSRKKNRKEETENEEAA